MSAPLRTSEKWLRLGTGAVLAVLVVLLLAPAVFAVILSFSNDAVIAFPPQTWGVQNYRNLLDSPEWLSALWLSVRLALVSAFIAVAVGITALMAIHRSRLPLRSWLEQAGLISLIIPVSAYAVAMYAVFSQYRLLGQLHRHRHRGRGPRPAAGPARRRGSAARRASRP